MFQGKEQYQKEFMAMTLSQLIASPNELVRRSGISALKQMEKCPHEAFRGQCKRCGVPMIRVEH